MSLAKSDNEGKTHHSHHGHRQRRKNYVLKHGCESFSDAELLEMLLFYAIPRVDTRVKAEQLIAEYGTLENVFNAESEGLRKKTGIKDNTEVFFKLLRETAKRCGEAVRDELPLEPARIKEYLIDLFREAENETVYALYFTPDGTLAGKQIIHRGKLSEVRFRMRTITEGAILSGGTFVVLAHNHPSEVLVPSEEDIIATKRIAAHLSMNDIELIDHYIVGKNDCVGILKMN